VILASPARFLLSGASWIRYSALNCFNPAIDQDATPVLIRMLANRSSEYLDINVVLLALLGSLGYGGAFRRVLEIA
jgi:hypothetical protein